MRKVRKDKLPTTTRRVIKHICPICDMPVGRIHDHLKKAPHWIKDDNEYRAYLKKKVLFEPGIPVKPLSKSTIVEEIIAMPGEIESMPENIEENEISPKISPSIPSKTNKIEEPGQAEPAEDFETCLGKFENYLLSISGGRKSVKNAFDEKSQIRTLAKLCSEGEPLSYHHVLNLKLVQDEYVIKYSKEKKHTPGTIKSYLLSLTHFMSFLKRSIERPDADNIIVVDTDKFPTEKLLVLSSEVSKWRESLRGEANQRQIEV